MNAKDVLLFKEAVCSNDMASVVRMLQDTPALAEARDDGGVSLLLTALYHGHRDLADMIASRRPSLDVFEAAAMGQVDAVRHHVRTDPCAVNSCAKDGFTPLHLATFFGKIDVARFILANGGDVGAAARNPSAVQPLHSAAATGDANVVRVILAAGADPDAKQAGGHTALHSAVVHGNVAMTIALLASGADPSIQNEEGKAASDLEPRANPEAVKSVLNTWIAMRACR